LPLYEYRCKKCGARFERIQKFSDAPLTKCEECGGRIERLLSSPAIQFKGTGWYVTDYAKKSVPGSGGEASSSDGGGTTDKAPKTEPSKTAPTKTAKGDSSTKSKSDS